MEFEEEYSLLSSTVSALMRCIQTIKSLALREFGLKGSSVNCLFWLSQKPEGATLTELTSLCQEDKAAVSRSLSDLQSEGFVCPGTNDGRRYRVKYFLTKKGLEAAGKLREVLREALHCASGFFTEEERRLFYTALGRVLAGLKGYIRWFDGGTEGEAKGGKDENSGNEGKAE